MRAHLYIFLLFILGPRWTFESCITKPIEGIEYINEKTSLEHVNINEILRSIFKVYSLALENNFTVNHINIIEITNGLICSEAGTGLEISESQDLQKLANIDRNYLLQIEWVNGRLLVFPMHQVLLYF